MEVQSKFPGKIKSTGVSVPLNQNAAVNQGIVIPVSDEFEKNVIHFVADNVDPNTAPLGSNRTFYGMGMVAVVTDGKVSWKPFPKRPVSEDEISRLGKIDFCITNKYFTMYVCVLVYFIYTFIYF